MNSIPDRKVINIVSAKGGTGKTLLSLTLADMLSNMGVSVLLVDLDIYVLGSTTLLSYSGTQVNGLVYSGDLSVADFFARKIRSSSDSAEMRPAISRYRAFDVFSGLAPVNESQHFDDMLPNSREEATNIINEILNRIPGKYDVILLDNRGGYDEQVSAAHSLSNVSVCVEEEGLMSNEIADALVSRLRNDAGVPVFRIVNKARNIRRSSSFENKARSASYLGRIPFDIDVINSFGDHTFWDEITRSLFSLGLARAWNCLATKLNWPWKLPERRASAIGSSALEELLGTFTWRDRVILVYGLAISVLGLGYALIGTGLFHVYANDPNILISAAIGILGAVMAIGVLFRLGRKP